MRMRLSRYVECKSTYKVLGLVILYGVNAAANAMMQC